MKNKFIFLTLIFAGLAGITTKLQADGYWRDDSGRRHYTRVGAATSNFLDDVFDGPNYDGRYHHLHHHHHIHHVND